MDRSKSKMKGSKRKRKIMDNPDDGKTKSDLLEPYQTLMKKPKSAKEGKMSKPGKSDHRTRDKINRDSFHDNSGSDEEMDYHQDQAIMIPKTKKSKQTIKVSHTRGQKEGTTMDRESKVGQVKSNQSPKQSLSSIKSQTDSDSDSASGSEEEESVDEEAQEMERVKAELSSMPFEELQKLKEKLGLKAFNQAMSKRLQSTHTKQQFKRENKNRPREMSSKKPVPRFRPIFDVKEKVHRDPRFDDLSGEYNEKLFQQSYGFLDNIKKKEKLRVEKELQKEKDPVKKASLTYLVNRMSQQERAAEAKSARLKLETQHKKEERELVKQGKAPFYLKNSEKRKLELADKYRELKKSGKIEKYLMKKRKKNAAKERKKLPSQHKMFSD